MRRFVKQSACRSVAAIAVFFAGAAVAQLPATSGTGKSTTLNVPIPVKQSASGVKFPYIENGKLRMFFNVDVMFRTDQDHMQMTNARVETYDDNGKPDMTVLLPVSLLDLNSRIVTTSKPFLVRRNDFSLVGETLELDTMARQGKVTGKVKMIIYNFGDTDKQEHK